MEINLFYLLCICLSIVVWRLFHDLKIPKNVEKSHHNSVLQQQEEKLITEAGEKPTFIPTESFQNSWSWSLKCQVGLDLKTRGKLSESSEIFSTLSLSEFLLKGKKQNVLPEWDDCLWEIGKESRTAGDYEKTLHIFSTIYQYQKEMKGEDHPTTLKILDELGRVLLKQKLMDDANLIAANKIKSTENVKNNKSLDTGETKKVSSSFLFRPFLWIFSLSKTCSSVLVYILSPLIWMSMPFSMWMRIYNPIHKSPAKYFNSNFGHWPLMTSLLVTIMALFISNIYDESLSLKNLPVETLGVQTNVVKYTLYFTILNSVVTLLVITMSFPIFEALMDFGLVSVAEEMKNGVKEGQSFIVTAVEAIMLFVFGILCLATKILVKEVLHLLLLLMTIVLTVFYVLL